MADQQITFTGTVRAGAIGFGDGQTVTGSLNETADDERPARPERPDRESGPTVVADSIEFGQ